MKRSFNRLWEHPQQHLSSLRHTTHSVLCLSSQQNSDWSTKSDHKYLSTLHHSNAPTLLLSLSNCSFLLPHPWVVVLLAMSTNSANLPMADQAGQQEISINEASFPSCDHSRLTTWGVHIKKGITSFDTSRRKNQRSKARPRCLVERAHHSSAASSTRPVPAPATSHYNSPWPSCQSQPHILARGRPGASSLDSSPALCHGQHHWAEPSSRHKIKQGILATALRDCTTT